MTDDVMVQNMQAGQASVGQRAGRGAADARRAKECQQGHHPPPAAGALCWPCHLVGYIPDAVYALCGAHMHRCRHAGVPGCAHAVTGTVTGTQQNTCKIDTRNFREESEALCCFLSWPSYWQQLGQQPSCCQYHTVIRIVPCCTVLCCAVLCCAVLCCAVLCCAVLCCAVLCRCLLSPSWIRCRP